MRNIIMTLLFSIQSAAARSFCRSSNQRAKAFAVVAALSLVGIVPAAAQTMGTASGLPLPRFVSLKSDRVNLREGPSKDHPSLWIYQRAGLPVEITAEFEIWYKIRDSEGTEGWVLHSLLSGRRTGLVGPSKTTANITLYSKPSNTAAASAALQPGVIGSIKNCDGQWCRIFGEDFDGYIPQTNLWGVYPDEKVN